MELLGSVDVLKAADYIVGVLLVRGLLLTALVVAAGLLLRGLSPARRTVLWAAGAGGLLLLPLFVELLPSWELGIFRFPYVLFESAGAAEASGVPPLAVWLAILWGIGALVEATRFGVHVLRIAHVTRRARPVDGGRLGRLVDEVTRRAGAPGVRVLLSDTPGVPLTWGLRRPVILLPTDAREWPEPLQRSVLEHEVAHVLRRDYLTLVGLEACRVLHWPNPLVWLLIRRAREDQERACDDVAIRSGIPPAEYARHLVAVARSFSLGPTRPVASLPIVRESSLARRVRDVMTRDADRAPVGPRALALGVCLVGLTVGLATANPWMCPAAEVPTAVEAVERGPAPALG